MHDVTEGGLATAVEELSAAGHHKIRIRIDKIPVYPQTEKICRLLGIAPLGLIGSGSLLIVCKKDRSHQVEKRIRKAGIDVACIGQVLEAGQGIQAVQDDQSVPWPRFEVDELARLFASNA
jgi:hydrogenase maturation factor